jgi:SAM-dependent methyltransferase
MGRAAQVQGKHAADEVVFGLALGEVAMPTAIEAPQTPATAGRVLHWAGLYDLVVWLFLRGRERAFRQRTLDLARVGPGESVLDVGCGTGTLALAARARVGPGCAVWGVDPSPQMIRRARHKARRAGLEVEFREATIEALPFPDAQFDLVLSTLMLHHLPRSLRAPGVREMRRVLKPGGRVFIMDFGAGVAEPRGLIARLHRHGGVDRAEITGLLRDAGLEPGEGGPLGTRDLHFVMGSAPGGG